MAIGEAAGSLGRSHTFLKTSQCPSQSSRGKGRGAQDHGYLMGAEDEKGKGPPGTLHGGGALLTLSLLISEQQMVRWSKGAAWCQVSHPTACVTSQAHSELG